METKKKILFISDPAHLNSDIMGGVQICTQEYLQLLELAGFDPIVFPVPHTKRTWLRIKIKLGIDAYDRYDFSLNFPKLKQVIESEDIKYVAVNQVSLSGFLTLLKEAYGSLIRTLVLSHGNESGDFLHEIARNKSRNWCRRLVDDYRLGLLLKRESLFFSNDADVVAAMSDTECEINTWLGARKTLFIPRCFNPQSLDWEPIRGRVGFVGTLDHQPNYDGLIRIISELDKLQNNHVCIRVVGGPESVGKSIQKMSSTVQYLGRLSEEELAREARTWCFFLNPVFWYSRGASTKLAQGVNWGIPVISTPGGNRGYSWTKGKILTVENAQEMASILERDSVDLEKLKVYSAEIKLVASNGPDSPQLANALFRSLLFSP